MSQPSLLIHFGVGLLSEHDTDIPLEQEGHAVVFNHLGNFLMDFAVGVEEHLEIACIDVDELNDNFEQLPLLALLMRDGVKHGHFDENLGQLYATQTNLIFLEHIEGPALKPAQHVHEDHALVGTFQALLVPIRQFLIYYLLAIAAEQFLVVQRVDGGHRAQRVVDRDEVDVHLIPLHNHILLELLVPICRQHSSLLL